MVSSLMVGDDDGIEISSRRLFRFDDYEADYLAALAAIYARTMGLRGGYK